MPDADADELLARFRALSAPRDKPAEGEVARTAASHTGSDEEDSNDISDADVRASRA